MMQIRPRALLQDMPYHIKQRIISNISSYSDRMCIRIINKDFCRIIGEIPMDIVTMKLEFQGQNYIDFTFLPTGPYQEANFTVRYEQVPTGCSVGSVSQFFRSVAPGDDYIAMSTNLFARLIDNVNLSVKDFCFTVKDPGDKERYPAFDKERVRFMDSVNRILKSLKAPLKVENFKIYYTGRQREVIQVLPFLDQNYLKKLQICVPRMPRNWLKISRILDLVQFKLLTKLAMFDLPDDQFPVEKWWNLARTHMKLDYIQVEDIGKLAKHFLTAPNFEVSILITKFDNFDIMQAIEKSINQILPWQLISGSSYHYHFEESAENKSLHVKLEAGTVQFSREIRN